MTTHPITPPRELIVQWMDELLPYPSSYKEDHEALFDRVFAGFITTKAACWGADQELEACVKLLSDLGGDGDRLRVARRPKPPSLKEQALAALETVDMLWDTSEFDANTVSALDTIRRALELLDD